MVKDISVVGFICVGKKDVDYLFKYALLSFLQHASFLSKVIIVTPEPELIRESIDCVEKYNQSKILIQVLPDSYFLSESELTMSGWSKQQLIKLRSYKLGSTHVLCLGADTILLKNINFSRLYNKEYEIIQYRDHKEENNHSRFEKERIANIATLLGLDQRCLQVDVYDYIFDLFLFTSSILENLENYFLRQGKTYEDIFPKKVSGYEEMKKIGEWSLHTLFSLHIEKNKYVLLDSSDYVIQVHSASDFSKYQFTGSAVHFVSKDFDISTILQGIQDKVYTNI